MKSRFSEKTLEKAKNRIRKIRSRLDGVISLVGSNVHAILSHERKMKDVHVPVDPLEVTKDLMSAVNKSDAEILIEEDGFQTFCVSNAEKYRNFLTELGRRREETFRAVGEGSWKTLDLDEYDRYYRHIVLWDSENRRIAWAYRIGVGAEIVRNGGSKGLYASTLFDYPKSFSEEYLSKGLELGRSFVAEEYRNGKGTLDRLWKGIASFVAKRQEEDPELRYFFGPVSMSERVSEGEKALLVTFCQKHLKWERLESPTISNVRWKNPFKVSKKYAGATDEFFSELEKIPWERRFKKSFAALMSEFKKANSPFPVLFFSYAEICDRDSFRYVAFHRDKKFASVDGLLLLDTRGITASAREKYGLGTLAEKEQSDS